MYHSGDSDREPLRNALDQSLYVAGANAAAATLVAVFARLTSGAGQHVDVSVAECLAAHLVQPVPYHNYMGATKGRRPVRGSGFEEADACPRRLRGAVGAGLAAVGNGGRPYRPGGTPRPALRPQAPDASPTARS